MTDSITLSKEQFEAWYETLFAKDDVSAFDSLKAFVEKPKRRDWVLESPEGKIYFLEELPGDILMTNDEAVKWVTDSWNKMHPQQQVSLRSILGALGLGEL